MACSAETKIETVYVYLEADTVSDAGPLDATTADTDPSQQDMADSSVDVTDDATDDATDDVAHGATDEP